MGRALRFNIGSHRMVVFLLDPYRHFGGTHRMLCKAFVLMLLLLSASEISAQIMPTPTPTPRPGTRAANPVIGDNANFDRLQSIEMMNNENAKKSHPLLDRKKGMYRKPSDDETRALAVNPSHLTAYASFLKQPNTGIVKLSGESSCAATTEVIVATPKCATLQMPGSGIAYSFRAETYRLPRLADIVLYQGMLGADAVMQQFALVVLANIKIEDVTLATSGLKYLVEVPAVRSGDEFTRFAAEIARGIQADGFTYRNGHPANNGGTYALRSIAYRGKNLRTIDGVPYDELDFDRRRDVIVAFQVIDVDPEGNVTMVWRRLRDLEAPKLQTKK